MVTEDEDRLATERAVHAFKRFQRVRDMLYRLENMFFDGDEGAAFAVDTAERVGDFLGRCLQNAPEHLRTKPTR